MRLNEIIERFKLVSGLGMRDVSRFLPIIIDCKDEIQARVSELTEIDLRRVEYACAVYAFYRVSQIGRLDDLSGFKVGDVQMDIEAVGEAAKRLWEAERAGISDIVDIDGEFAFRSVSV